MSAFFLVCSRKMITKITLVIISFFLASCSYVDRLASVNESGYREFSKSRNKSVVLRETVTRYTGALSCVGNKIVEEIPKRENKPYSPDSVAVGMIDDKSGKLSGMTTSPLPQGTREMATRALGQVKSVNVLEAIDLAPARVVGENVPFARFQRDDKTGRWVPAKTEVAVPVSRNQRGEVTEQRIETRNDVAFLQPAQHSNLLNALSVNTLRPGQFVRSDFYITGAITEYSDQKVGLSSGVNILDFGVSYSQRNVDIVVDLRLVSSTGGQVLRSYVTKDVFNSNEVHTKPYVTASLRNTVRSVELNGSYFRVSDNNVTSANMNSSMSDPVHFAVREAIEGAVAVLIGKLYGVDYEKCLQEAVTDELGENPWDRVEREDQERAKNDKEKGINRTILFAPSKLPGASTGGASVPVSNSPIEQTAPSSNVKPVSSAPASLESIISEIFESAGLLKK
jgi:curli biogenesis system outer membrane secretion channel CsgG